MDSVLPVQNENFSGHGKELAKVSWTLGFGESHLHCQVIGIWQSLWRSFLESLYVYTTPIGNEWDCWHSGAQNQGRDICGIVATRLGWKVVGWFYGMPLLSAKHSRSLVCWANSRQGQPNKGPIIPCWCIGWVSPLCLRETSHGCTSLASQWYLERSSDVFAGGIWKGDLVVADIEDLEKLDAWEILARRVNAKEVITPKREWQVYIPNRRWNGKIVRKRLWCPRIHSGAGPTCTEWRPQRKTSRKLWEVSTDETKDDPEARDDFWSMEGDFIHCHHVEPRVQLYVPKEELFPIPRKYIDVTRAADTNLDVMQESRIDGHWNVDVDRHLSDSWTHNKNEEPPNLRKSSNYQTLIILWPVIWSDMLKAAQKKEKQEWAFEKPTLDDARRPRVIYFIDPEDGEYKEDRKKTPCKMGTKKRPTKLLEKQTAKPKDPTKSRKQRKHACIVEAHESTRQRLESALPEDHEDHIVEKRVQFVDSLHFGAQMCSDASSNEISDAKAAVDKEWWMLAKVPVWQLSKVKSKKIGHSGSTERANNRPFCNADGHLWSQECGVGTEVSKVQRPSCAAKWHCERRLRLVCCIHRARFVCVTNDRSKSDGCHRKITWLCRTSSRRSIRLHSSENGGRSQIAQDSEVRVSR